MRNQALFVAMLCGTTALHAQATDPWRKVPAAPTTYFAQVDKENADISARSAAWFGPGGKFTAWLASYRATVLDPNAKAEEANDEIKTAQMAIMETPTAAFRSTAQMTAVREYLDVMRKVYDLRINKEPNVHRMAGEP